MPRRTSRSPRRIQRSPPRSNTSRSGPARSGTASSGAAWTSASGGSVASGAIVDHPRGTVSGARGPCPWNPRTSQGTPPRAFPYCVTGVIHPRRTAPPPAASRSPARTRRAPSPYPPFDGGLEPMSRPVRTALLACLALAFGLAAGAAAAAPPPVLDRELFFGNPEIAARPALPRRPVRGLPQALERHPQHLGQEDGRALRGGPPGDRRDEAAHPGVLLHPRQPPDPLRQGQRRRRELQRLGRRPRRGRRPRARRSRPRGTSPTRRERGPSSTTCPRSPRTRSTSASTTATPPGTTSTRSRSPPASASSSARTPTASRAGSSTSKASSGWPCAPPTRATPRS